MIYTKNYWNSIKQVNETLQMADKIIVGAGAGMSAASGLDYTNPLLLEKWFPQYAKKGFTKIIDIQSLFWNITKQNVLYYWGYWANHIYHIRYEAQPGKTYLRLYDILQNKDYYIITTNVDGQFEKAGFKKEFIFAMQGNYAFFQCERACTDEVYNNRVMIENMIKNMDFNMMRIQKQDIPYCPNCGSFLVPNLRKDEYFVEEPHMQHEQDYNNYIKEASTKKLVLLELGVGFNTPTIIRYPFEAMTLHYNNTNLIRVNNRNAIIPEPIKNKGIGLQVDISKVLEDIHK